MKLHRGNLMELMSGTFMKTGRRNAAGRAEVIWGTKHRGSVRNFKI